MKELAHLRKNVILAEHTTFCLGGPAKYFIVVQNEKELKEALFWAKKNKLPIFILGGGSNVLIKDEGFEGLVIKIANKEIKIAEENNILKVECDAGVAFNTLITRTTKKGYVDAAWGLGIPGTVGGAIYGNAGRLNHSFSEIVETITVLDKNLKIKKIAAKNCNFVYRGSRFKKTKEIILKADLVFKRKQEKELEETLSQAKEIIKKAPPFPSAGCVFKNYQIKSKNDILLKNHPELKAVLRSGKISVGYLIDQSGLAGQQIGGARIWEGHANYIINTGGAKAADVLELIKLVKATIKEKYGIKLEEEIKIL